MTILRGFNDGALALAPDVGFSVSTFITAFNTVLKMVEDANIASEGLLENYKKFVDAFNKMKLPSAAGLSLPSASGLGLPSASQASQAVGNLKAAGVDRIRSSLPTLPQRQLGLPQRQLGGANVRKRINHITRRLKKTIKQFINNKHRTRKYHRK